MSIETAASVLAGLIFVSSAYLMYYKVKYGRWPWTR